MVVLVALCYLRPELTASESVALVEPRRLVDPDFLRFDWSLGGDPLSSLSAVFHLMCAPLFRIFADERAVAGVGRLLSWSLLVWPLLRITRWMGLSRTHVFIAFAIWLTSNNQSFAAGEWMFRGFEHKCIGYFAVLWGVVFAIERRAASAGLAAGVASMFDVLVGGYGGVGLGVALLADWRRIGVGGVLRYGLVCLPFALFSLALGVVYLQQGRGAWDGAWDPGRIDALMVFTVHAKQVDPLAFFDFWKDWTGIPFLALLFLGLSRAVPRDTSRILTPFLGFLAFSFFAGCVARLVGVAGLLKFDPFRVGDTLLPLFFWLVTVPMAADGLRRLRGGTPRLSWPGKVGASLIVLAVGLNLALSLNVFRIDFKRTLDGWREFAVGERDAFSAAADWVRAKAPPDAVFAIPPCRPEFWLEGERAVVAQYGRAPSNGRAPEWYERMVALNGGSPLSASAREVCGEVEIAFRSLDAPSLAALHERFGATHYLVDVERPEFVSAQRYAGDGWWVYDIGQEAR